MSADDESKNPDSEANTGQPGRLDRVESRQDSIWEFVERLEERIAEQDAVIDDLRARLEDVDYAEQTAVNDLRERLADVEERTDMQRLVDRIDGASAKQRSLALLQHLRRKAVDRQRRGHEPVAALDRDGAQEAMHHPEIDRTQYYKDMERAARWFADDICWYDSGELWLDLTDVRGGLSQHMESVKASPHSDGESGGQTPPTGGDSNKLG